MVTNTPALTRTSVERILRACVAERERHPAQLPGQTERLCRALLAAWDADDAPCVTRFIPDSRPICAYLRDGTKVRIAREGLAAWLEVVPQAMIGVD